jgi:serine/threonine protein kinase
VTDYVEGQVVAPSETPSPSPRAERERKPVDVAPERRRTNIGPYKLERRIEGGKAECWMCKDTRDGERKFLKKFPSPKMPSETDRSHDRASYDSQVAQCNAFMEQHKAVMRDIAEDRLGSGSLVRPLDAFWFESSFFKVYPFIDDLRPFSAESTRGWDAGRRIVAIRSVLLALRELHDRNIVHGDIKRENIHLVEFPGGLVARLIDFDDSYRVDAPPPKTTLGGTEDYYSPEVLVYKGFADSALPLPLGLASDVFSISLAIHEALSASGRQPRWNGRETADAAIHALAGDPVEYLPLGTGRKLLEFRLKQCLAVDPRDRPRVSELLSASGANLGRIA